MLWSLYECGLVQNTAGLFFIGTKAYCGLSCPRDASQAKKKHYDVELENLEKLQKQTIERMEANHNVKLKEETKRIKSEQERDYHKFQDQLKQKKKEVCLRLSWVRDSLRSLHMVYSVSRWFNGAEMCHHSIFLG